MDCRQIGRRFRKLSRLTWYGGRHRPASAATAESCMPAPWSRSDALRSCCGSAARSPSSTPFSFRKPAPRRSRRNGYRAGGGRSRWPDRFGVPRPVAAAGDPSPPVGAGWVAAGLEILVAAGRKPRKVQIMRVCGSGSQGLLSEWVPGVSRSTAAGFRSQARLSCSSATPRRPRVVGRRAWWVGFMVN